MIWQSTQCDPSSFFLSPFDLTIIVLQIFYAVLSELVDGATVSGSHVKDYEALGVANTLNGGSDLTQ